jgi:hypothetical protein
MAYGATMRKDILLTSGSSMKKVAIANSVTRMSVSFFAAILLAVACAGRAESETPLAAELLARAKRENTVRVIVELQSQARREEIQEAQEMVLHALEGTRYRVTRRYHIAPFLALEVSAEALHRLARLPAVRGIEEDRLRSPQETTP